MHTRVSPGTRGKSDEPTQALTRKDTPVQNHHHKLESEGRPQNAIIKYLDLNITRRFIKEANNTQTEK